MIRMTTYNGADDGGVEEFADLETLAADLHDTADAAYENTVISAFRGGATEVTVVNGNATDVYKLVDE